MFTGTIQLHDATDVLTPSTIQQHDLGARGIAKDGRKFRYLKIGATAITNAGLTLQAPAIVPNHQNVAAEAAAALGAFVATLTLGATAATANQYAEGFLVINDVTGEGHTYRIKSHAAVASSGVMTVRLYDPIKVALTTSSEACLIANPYNGAVVFPTTATGMFVGVAPYAIPANNFAWVQTYGVCSLLAAGTIGVGLGIAVPGAVAGAGTVMAATLAQIGHALQAAVDTEYRAVFLNSD